ncbi:unnamed protein product [Allacma fusca]|uniref:Uncharacterized protein n=1 Tax=Allacma fusca TaxID=39272 RepID=A0A8J2LR50_9HEXA|nr:unnamed protein product [Allacma fusca]
MKFVKIVPENTVKNPKCKGKTSIDLWSYLCLLRISATRPISQRNELIDDTTSRTVFFVKWFSPITFFSAAVSVFSLYLLTVMLLNGVLEVYWPQKLFEYNDQILRPSHHSASSYEVIKFYKISNFMLPTSRLIVILHQMINLKGIVKQLNAISGLADDLQIHCASRCGNFSSKIRRNSIRTIALLVGIPAVTVFPVIVFLFSNDLILAPVILREVIIVLVPLQLVVIYFEDADFIIQCDIVSEFFRQIEMVLVETEDYLKGKHCNLHLTEVRKWHQFLLRNRRIVGQIGTITKVPQLLSLVEVTSHLTMFLYTVLNVLASPGTSLLENYFLRMSFSYVVVILVRLQAKTLKAEQVTAAEVRVHDALFALNEFPQALEVQLELQGMRNTITATPSHIAFGNYCTLSYIKASLSRYSPK